MPHASDRLETRGKALRGPPVLKDKVRLNKTFTFYMCVEVISHLILEALPGTHFLIHFFHMHDVFPQFIATFY